jgi:AcrR family transcriptional regulator
MGFEGVTLTALADRFGVAVPSLYKHVAGIDDVRRRIAIQSIEEFGDAIAEALTRLPRPATGLGAGDAGSAQRDALGALADAYRRYASDHPGRYAATVRAPHPDALEHARATRAVLAVVLALLDGYGLAGDDAIHAARAVRSALHGFVALEAAAGFGLPQDVERSYASLVDGLHVALREWRVR